LASAAQRWDAIARADALDRRPPSQPHCWRPKAKCSVLVSKLDRLSRDVAFISGLMPNACHSSLPNWAAMPIRSCCTSTQLSPKGTPPNFGADQRRGGGRKAIRGVLGNPRNVAEAGKLGRKIQVALADEFTRNVLPVVDALRHGGAVTLEAISWGAQQARHTEGSR